MKGLIACEPEFIRSLVQNPASTEGLLLRYGMLAKDLLSLLSSEGMGLQQMNMLTGLIEGMRLKGLDSSQIACMPTGGLKELDPEYLKLGICCSGAFFHNINITAEDKTTFNQNNVYVSSIGEIDFFALAKESSHKVVNEFSLKEGGNISIVNCIGQQFRRANKVKIYDRYFNRSSLVVVEQLLEDAVSRSGLLTGEILVLTGTGPTGISIADVMRRIARYYINENHVNVVKSQKVKSNDTHLHDRYIQIDQSRTFVMTAGISAFIDSNGKNRASQIFEIDLFVGFNVAKVLILPGREVVEIKY